MFVFKCNNIQVEDLMVPEELRSQYKAEAESLLSVEITKLDLQWLQVLIITYYNGYLLKSTKLCLVHKINVKMLNVCIFYIDFFLSYLIKNSLFVCVETFI